MRLETSASWRGWTALVSIALAFIFAFIVMLGSNGEPARSLCGTFGLIAVITFFGWVKRRRQMQKLDYHARMVGKAVSGD